MILNLFLIGKLKLTLIKINEAIDNNCYKLNKPIKIKINTNYKTLNMMNLNAFTFLRGVN
jgi:hypothetical protein